MNLVYVALLCLPGNVYQEFFDRGNLAYEENRLDEAVLAYERLVSSDVRSAAVFYNLASAYYHFGDTGRAVLNYERALAVDPDYDPAQRGLEAIAVALPRTLEMPPDFRSTWRARTPWLPGLLAALLLVFWWLFWGILLSAVWRRAYSPRRIAAITLSSVITASALAFILIGAPEAGVVLAEELPLRYGPDDRDSVRAQLRAGDRLCIERTVGAWACVETGAGLRGWVRREELGAVSPPFQN